MGLERMISLTTVAMCVIGSSGIVEIRRLRATVNPTSGKNGTISKASPDHAPKSQANGTQKPQRHLSEADKLEALGNSLKMVHNLRSMFRGDLPTSGAATFANGALSTELSNKDSQVWATIESMLGAVQQVSKSMKGKQKSEREKLMASLEGELNDKANVLSNVTVDVGEKQKQQDEQYMLGLLILHQKDWTMEKQLNATATFMHTSPVLRQLYAHHDASKPLAPQLAALMDAETKHIATNDAAKPTHGVSPVVGDAAKPDSKKAVSKAASAAAHLFIQLVDTFQH